MLSEITLCQNFVLFHGRKVEFLQPKVVLPYKRSALVFITVLHFSAFQKRS